MINSISLNGSVLTSEETTASVAQQPVATPSDEPPVESTGEVATVVAASVDQQQAFPVSDEPAAEVGTAAATDEQQ